MTMKSAAGIACYVQDMKRTETFYEALGFQFKRREPERASAYLNWFWIDFLPVGKAGGAESRKEAKRANQGAGLSLYISVDDVDTFHAGLLAKGLKPSGEPQDTPWGNREFVLRDPDGYKLVFFKRK